MKWLAMVLIAMSAIGAAQTPAAGSKAKKLSPDELKTLLEKKEIFFLDVREPKELEETGTIKGYTNIPIGQLESRYQEVPKDRLIVTACAHGVRAARAAEILEKHGYKMAGACGLVEWKEKGYPLIYPKDGAKK
jgi:rhodanese-related sulfurtransferase